MYRSALGLAVVFLSLGLLDAAPARAEGAGLHGRVFALDAQGDVADVVVGAEIQLLDASGAVVARTTSGAGGYYKVALPAGTYRYKVTATGFKDEDVKRGVRQELTEGWSVFDFALTPGPDDAEEPGENPQEGEDDAPPGGTTIPAQVGTLYGTVHERSSDGTLVGIADARVQLARADGADDTQVLAGGQGGYEIVLTTGTWHATAFAPGYEPLVDGNPIEITQGRRTNRDFLFVRPRPPVVPGGQGIRGTIRLLTDPDASARTPPTPTIAILPLTPQATHGAAPGVDAQGAYRSDLAVGTYEVVASATGYETARSGPRGVHAGRTTHVDLTLRPSRSESGPTEPTPQPVPDPTPPPQPTPPPTPGAPPAWDLVVTVSVPTDDDVVGRRPLVGARVRVAQGDEDGPVWGKGVTNARGEVRFRELVGGTYVATVYETPGGHGPESATVDVVGPSESRVDILLAPIEAPAPTPTPADRGPTLAIQVLERGPDRVLRVVAGASVSVGAGPEGAAGKTTDDGGWCTVPLLPGGQHVEVRGADGHVATLDLGFVPEARFVELERRDADGAVRLELRLPVAVQVVLGARDAPDAPDAPERPDVPPDAEGATRRLVIHVVEPGENERASRPVDGARVHVLLGEGAVDEGVTKAGVFTSKALRVMEGYYAFAEKEGYLPAEVPTPIEEPGPFTLVLRRVEEPGSPPREPPPEGERAELLVRVLTPEGQPVRGALVEVHWGPEGRDEVRARGVTEGRDPLFRTTLPRAGYWVSARAELPGRGPAWGEAAVPPDWIPAKSVLVQLHAPDGPGPGEPPPVEPPTEPRAPQPPGRAEPAPLQIQVLGPDGRPFAGAQVEVHWGPHGKSEVRGRASSQGRAAIAQFQLPREDYWVRAVAQAPGGGRLTGQEAVGRGWNPAIPIRVHLHAPGGPAPPTPPPTQPGPPRPPPQQPPPAAKAQLTVRVLGLDLNAPISTVQPLGGARVTVRGGGGSWSGQTNAGGHWNVALAPGAYQIEVTAAGMERAANAGVTMGARNVTKELTIKLRGPR